MVRCDAEVHLLIFAECFIYQFCAECSQKPQQPLLFPLVGLQGLPGALDLLAFELCCIRYLKHSFLWAATPNLKTFAHTVISTDILLPCCPIPMQPLFCLEEDVMLHAETCSFSTVTCVWKTSKGSSQCCQQLVPRFMLSSHFLSFLMLFHWKSILEKRCIYH